MFQKTQLIYLGRKWQSYDSMRSILLVVRLSLAAVLLSVVDDPYLINPTGDI